MMHVIQEVWLTGIVLLGACLFSMLGLGGGQLYVPIFFWLGLDLKLEAIPAALLINFLTQCSATTTYLREKLVEFRTALPFVVTLAVCPLLGAGLTQYVSDRIILALFAVFLILVAVRMLVGWKPRARKMKPVTKTLVGLTAGSMIGVVVGMLGRGGGAFVVPVLLMIGFDPKRAAATSAFVVCFSSLSGFLGHLAMAHLGGYLIAFAIAAIIGSQIGSRFMVRKMKGKTLTRVFAGVLAAVGLIILVRVF
jgi:uncharacterized membrane protein YfcA